MSKAHDPHWRYVALRLSGGRAVSRRALQNALLGRARKEEVADADAPQLTRYAWPHAIVRVHHHQLGPARAWLPRVDFAVDGERVPLQVVTVGASGTIKALTERLGILQERGPKGDARPARPDQGGKPAGRPAPKGPVAAPGRGSGPRGGGGPARPPGRDASRRRP